VVDAQTGAPVAGAVVVAAWSASYVPVAPFLGPAHSSVTQCLQVAERVTDANGHFDIPGKPDVPAGWQKDRGSFPMVWFVKPGYEPEWRDPGRLLTGMNAYRDTLDPPSLARPYSLSEGAVVALYRYGNAPVPSVEKDWPQHRRSATEKALDKLGGMATFLDGNIRLAGTVPGSAAEAVNMENERQALLMVDAEIRDLRGRPWEWGGPARDYVRSEAAKARE
jgi:hypothetical protein